ncbi:hypothetical protein ACFY00_30540 [Kitasatospora sp. NPDC001540]|uniref:hypothetical protein n=1 Tax=Kitasatospora sp. NPDC001540 TaxID=3364014 RepID=UPI00369CF1B2
MRYGIVPKSVGLLLDQLTCTADSWPPRTAGLRRTPTEERLVAAASPLRDGPRHRFRHPMHCSTGAAAPILAAA